MTSLSKLLTRTLMLDLETTRSGKIRHMGAIFKGEVFERKEKAGSKATLKQFEAFARDAEFVLGHNLLGHDFPILKAVSPGLEILHKPVVDTLYLSPIAFPQNPYHRLVKDYKLVRSSISSPVDDAKLAASVFEDQWNSFVALAKDSPALLDFYRFCFEKSLFNTFPGEGMASVFSQISARKIKTGDDALQSFLEHTDGVVCAGAVKTTIPHILSRPDRRPAAAYCMAWLQVAGGNSILPPWVRYRFPEIPSIIKTLREIPCGDPSCKYCIDNHDPDRQLTRLFGYPSFREKPATESGTSLQKAIVTDALGDVPLLGVLPTGGGKSLCYQLPALVRYWRRGTLTVVISPLQALMKDQVDNLVKKTGTLFAEAVSGLQTLPERGEVFERIRLGDTAILYISPEQLRSIGVRNVLKQREIGAWVFDEAHCLSKWGHDFRPDYLYTARFIREFSREQNQPVPPVSCFTATAKTSVIEEIESHFKLELEQDLRLHLGGIERENLSFEVIPVSEAEKAERVHDIITEELEGADGPAGIIVYGATRAGTEEIRDFLLHQGVLAEAFHGGLDAKVKRETIDGFIEGEISVICATNAFGMGIDKENIRLVLHYDIPGSLENYIQEAGRAGRDLKSARCILLYDPQDVSRQFQMGAMSEVRHQEIARILRALRRKKRNRKGEIVITSDELVRDEDLADLHGLSPEGREKKVQAAVAWLERAGFLKRNHNLTDVFQGKLLVDSLAEAEKVMERLNLGRYSQNLWLNILQILINAREDQKHQGVRADSIAEALFPEKNALVEMEKSTGQTAAQMVINALHDMADAGLIDQGIMLSATLRAKGRNNASKIFRTACDLETRLVRLLQELDPDADNGGWVDLNIPRLNQRLNNEDLESTPDMLRQLIKGISYDGKGFAAAPGSFELKYVDYARYRVRLQRSWTSITKTISLRQNVAQRILNTLLEKAERQASESGVEVTGTVQVAFASNDLSDAIKSDIILSAEVKKILPAIDRALMFLHEQKIIELQGGLAILRRAMTIRMEEAAKGRYYGKGDYKPLAVHYREKRLQVHVMKRYADLALEKLADALTLVLDYFALGRIRFINKYFAHDKDLLDKAATAESYRMIVENLHNPVQISAVGKPVEDNMLILAGPGSGKTTIIVHRCAYLVEVERIPARQILVLCFNHSSAMELKKRLFGLIGRAAKAVTVATYHGVAMRLAGISIRDMAEARGADGIDFEGIIKHAVTLLKGERGIHGMEPDELRDRLLSGYSHILVDEYQDIDENQYQLVAAIAGKALEAEDSRLTLLAVGDDDQNIYTFRGANVHYIRRFQEDYEARIIYLVENYRSSKHIIAASNALIRHNRDRMKGEHPIRINRERAPNLAGGRWTELDPVSQGRVQVISVRNLLHQAHYVKSEMDRMRNLDPNVHFGDFAVLSRTKVPLAAVRSFLEEAKYPFRTTLDTPLPLHRVREIHLFLQWLGTREKENHRASELGARLSRVRDGGKMNIWWQLIETFLSALEEDTLDSLQPSSRALDRFYEFLAEQSREKVMGQGVFMSTIHSAKGMEFPHVFVLDGDWRRSMDKGAWEEERRVMYVGMTRAEETLRLLRMSHQPNPLLKDMGGDNVIRLTSEDVAESGGHTGKKYEMLNLSEIYLDYAGTFPRKHPIHEHLAAVETGQNVCLCRNSEKLEIQDLGGGCLGRLSMEGARNWGERLQDILEVRVAAMLERERDDPDEPFQKRIKADRWEVPILEIVTREGIKRKFRP
jgi:ATP-dependent DNA helicase RecQ